MEGFGAQQGQTFPTIMLARVTGDTVKKTALLHLICRLLSMTDLVAVAPTANLIAVTMLITEVYQHVEMEASTAAKRNITQAQVT